MSHQRKRNPFWFPLACAIALIVIFMARAYITEEIVARLENRIDNNLHTATWNNQAIAKIQVELMNTTKALDSHLLRANNVEKQVDSFESMSKSVLSAYDVLLKTLVSNDARVKEFTEMRKRVEEIEKTLDVYRPVLQVITSNDIKILEKLNQEIKDRQPNAAVPMRTATSLLVASKYYDLDLPFLTAVAHVESTFQGEVESSASAKGLMQVSDLIWDNYRGLFPWDINVDVFDEMQNAIVAARYLSDIATKYPGDYEMLQHYNGGPSAIKNNRSVKYANLVLSRTAEFADSLN